mgnify:CR=1 FL=1
MINIFFKYKIEILVILLQLIEPLGVVGVFVVGAVVFYKVAFTKHIDIVSIFILLLPSIAFRTIPENIDILYNQQDSNNWIKVYFPTITNVFMLGPIAVSPNLMAAFAVPVRLLINLKTQTNKILSLFWLVCLLISIYGLFLALDMDSKSDGGLTVGIRIAMSIGAILFPFAIEKSNLETQILLIAKFSLIFFIIGILNNQWVFVTAAFPAFIMFSDEKSIWKILSTIILIIMISFSFTFTLKLTAIISFIILLFYNRKKLSSFFFNNNLRKYLLFLFPILFMSFIVFYDVNISISGNNTVTDRFLYKLLEDRGTLWKYSMDLILNSDFFLVPAARDIAVWDYSAIGEGSWGIGSHNIYLEIARQLGLFSTIIITVIFGYFLITGVKLVKRNVLLSQYLFALIASYLVFGLTGNSLVYDGVGFLYWLIVGQIYQVGVIMFKTEVQPAYNKTIYN